MKYYRDENEAVWIPAIRAVPRVAAIRFASDDETPQVRDIPRVKESKSSLTGLGTSMIRPSSDVSLSQMLEWNRQHAVVYAAKLSEESIKEWTAPRNQDEGEHDQKGWAPESRDSSDVDVDADTDVEEDHNDAGQEVGKTEVSPNSPAINTSKTGPPAEGEGAATPPSSVSPAARGSDRHLGAVTPELASSESASMEQLVLSDSTVDCNTPLPTPEGLAEEESPLPLSNVSPNNTQKSSVASESTSTANASRVETQSTDIADQSMAVDASNVSYAEKADKDAATTLVQKLEAELAAQKRSNEEYLMKLQEHARQMAEAQRAFDEHCQNKDKELAVLRQQFTLVSQQASQGREEHAEAAKKWETERRDLTAKRQVEEEKAKNAQVAFTSEKSNLLEKVKEAQTAVETLRTEKATLEETYGKTESALREELKKSKEVARQEKQDLIDGRRTEEEKVKTAQAAFASEKNGLLVKVKEAQKAVETLSTEKATLEKTHKKTESALREELQKIKEVARQAATRSSEAAKSEIDRLSAQLDNLRNVAAKSDADKQEVEAKLREVSNWKFQTEQTMASDQARLKILENDMKEQELRIAEHEASVGKAKEALALERDRARVNQAKMEGLEKRLRDKDDELKELKTRHDAELAEMKAALEAEKKRAGNAETNNANEKRIRENAIAQQKKLSERVKELKQKIKELEERLHQSPDDRIAAFANREKDLRADIAKKEAEAKKAREQCDNQIRLRVEDTKKSMKALMDKKNEAKARLEAETAKADLERRLKEVEASLAQRGHVSDTDVQRLQADLNETKRQLVDKEQQWEVQRGTWQTRLNEATARERQMEGERAGQQKVLRDLQSQVAVLKVQVKEIEQDRNKMGAEKDNEKRMKNLLSNEVTGFKKEKDARAKEIDQLKSKMAKEKGDLEDKLKVLSAEKERLEGRLNSTNQKAANEIDAVKERVDSLSEDVRRLKGELASEKERGASAVAEAKEKRNQSEAKLKNSEAAVSTLKRKAEEEVANLRRELQQRESDRRQMQDTSTEVDETNRLLKAEIEELKKARKDFHLQHEDDDLFVDSEGEEEPNRVDDDAHAAVEDAAKADILPPGLEKKFAYAKQLLAVEDSQFNDMSKKDKADILLGVLINNGTSEAVSKRVVRKAWLEVVKEERIPVTLLC